MATVVPAPVGATGWGKDIADLASAIADPGKKKRQEMVAEHYAKSLAGAADIDANLKRVQLQMSKMQLDVMRANPQALTDKLNYELQTSKLQNQLLEARTNSEIQGLELIKAQAEALSAKQTAKAAQNVTPGDVIELLKNNVIDTDTALAGLEVVQRGGNVSIRSAPMTGDAWYKPWTWGGTTKNTMEFSEAYKRWLDGTIDNSYMQNTWHDLMVRQGYMLDNETLEYKPGPNAPPNLPVPMKQKGTVVSPSRGPLINNDPNDISWKPRL